jgi:hypothetical protein
MIWPPVTGLGGGTTKGQGCRHFHVVIGPAGQTGIDVVSPPLCVLSSNYYYAPVRSVK